MNVRAALTVVCLTAAALVLLGPGAVRAQSQGAGVRGEFSLIQMIHTQGSIPQFSVPATIPLSGAFRDKASYSYRSIPCTGNAPVNNIASDLPSYNTRIAGSRSPSSMRAHPFTFRMYRTAKGWEMRGSIYFTVCKLAGGPTANPDPVPDVSKPKIVMTFRAAVTRMNAEEIAWTGTFRIVRGTGRYEGLTGSGTFAGYFFCFDPRGCATAGFYADGQMAMHGTYSDPTPQLEVQG